MLGWKTIVSLLILFGGIAIAVSVWTDHHPTELLPFLLLAFLSTGAMRAHIDEGGFINNTLRRLGISPRWRISIDIGLYLAAATLWVLVTGGARSPFVSVFLVPILLAAIRSGLIASVSTSLIASLIIFALLVFSPQWDNLLVRSYLQGNILILNLIAIFAGVLARRIGLTAQLLEHQASQAIALHDLSQMMESAYDLETTLNLVTIILRILFPKATACAIFLTDSSGKRLEIRTSSGLDDEDTRDIFLLMEEEEHGWAPVDGIPLLVCDASQYPHTRLKKIFPGAGSLMGVPLRSIEGIIGLIALAGDHPDEFTDDELHLAELFATRVAFPLQRARLQQDLQWMAFTDALTGLYNHRFFQEQFREELEKSKRYRHLMSFILIDIDRFKQFNDQYGHLAGDRVLSLVASLIKREIRHADIAARYGGEEFAIICPETPKQAASSLAERLREAIEAEQFHPVEGLAVPMTISAGVSTFPEDGQSRDDLIGCADRALYEAKHAGRNTIRTASPPGIEQTLD